MNSAGADTALNFNKGTNSIESITFLRFCGNDNIEIWQMNLSNLTFEAGTLKDVSSTSLYNVENYSYTSSKRSCTLKTKSAGKFVIYSYKGGLVKLTPIVSSSPEEKTLSAGSEVVSFSGGTSYWYQYLILKY